jgi:uncharacterized protein with FMN-binding domain
MRRVLTSIAGAATIALPAINTASAATSATVKPKVTTVKKTVTGTDAQVDRWGTIRVTLVVKKTTTVTKGKKKIVRSIVGVTVPSYPNHTDRSVYINQQAIPLLVQETLKAQGNVNNMQLVSGATDTSNGFAQSLQSALLQVKTV